MKRMLMVSVLLLNSITFAQTPDIEWRKTFSTVRGDNEGWMVQETRDGGLIIVGQNGGYNGNTSDIYLVKTNSFGDTLWTRSYDMDTDEYGRAIRQTPDGGYVVTGYFWNSNLYGDDIYLRKIDSLGNTLWRHIYQYPHNENARSLELTPDGGYIMAGGVQSPTDSDVLIVRTDSIGDTIWTRQYGGDCYDRAWAIKNTHDGGFIIAGWSDLHPAPQTNSQIYVIKINGAGDTLWSRRYGTPYNDEARSVLELPDHKYIIAGKFGTGSVTAHSMLLCLDENGDSLWSSVYDSNYEATSVARTFDGGFVLCGFNYDNNYNIYSEFVRKTDSIGNSLWEKSGIDSTYAHYIIQTSDSGYVFTGYASDSVSLTKISPERSIGIHINDNPLPEKLYFNQNYPNPFNSSTTLTINGIGKANIRIFDITGRLVTSLYAEDGKAVWDATGLSSGIYFARVEVDQNPKIIRMVLLK